MAVLADYRHRWVVEMMERENRIGDLTALTALQRNSTFFASTTMFIIAGLVAGLGATDKAIQLIAALPFAVKTDRALWELKILLLVLIFIFAFFKFTWSLRQYNFAAIMYLGAPDHEKPQADKQHYSLYLAKMLSLAGNEFTNGLRACYFGLAVLPWFIHPLLFAATTVWVVAVLHRREFSSRTLRAMLFKEREHEDGRQKKRPAEPES